MKTQYAIWLSALLAAVLTLPSVQAAPRLDAYGRLPGVELMRLSPSGKFFAFIATGGEQRKLGVATAGGRLFYSTVVGDFKVRNIAWAGDDQVLVTTSSMLDLGFSSGQRYEFDKVIQIDLNDHRARPVFGESNGISNVVLGYFGSASIGGHHYAYFGGIAQNLGVSDEYALERGYRDLYRVDLETGKTVLVARGGEQDYDWVLGADGSVLAHSEYEPQHGEWRLYAGTDRTHPLLQKTGALSEIHLLGQGRAPGTVLVVDGSGDQGQDALVQVSVSAKTAAKPFGEPAAGGTIETLTDFLFDPLSGQLLGASTREEPGAYFFDDRLQARFNGTRKAFPGLNVQLVSYSSNLDRLIVKTDGGDDSGTYWLVDIASGNAKPIGRAYPGITETDVAATRLLKYKAADGLQLEGVLTLPRGRKPEHLPLVLMPHGGPIGVSDRPGFDWWAQAYAASGYAVFQPNFRGSSGYGKALKRAGFGEWGGKMQTDLSDAVSALAAQGIVDRSRVCIVGASYGGYAALAGVTLQHGLYRCAVSVAGLADMPAFFRWNASRYGDRGDTMRYWRAVTGADRKGDAAMLQISPAQHAAQADAPILLIHGKDDTRVPIEQSEIMAAALKQAGKPYEFVALSREDHFLSREATRIEMLKSSMDFVKRNNPPD